MNEIISETLLFKKEPLSISIIGQLIKQQLKSLLNDIEIIGEIGEFKVNEHVYLRLYDPMIQDVKKQVFLDLFIWKNQWWEMQQNFPKNFKLDKGQKIIITGILNFHQGKVTCIVKTLELTEEGKLHLAYLKLCQKLQPLFATTKPKIPFLPKHIAVVTSEKAQGFGDILSTWNNHTRKYPFSHTVFPCNVQGKEAANSIINALEYIYENYEKLQIDCILMVRGGGSSHDLSCFNDEKLALTLAKSPLCVITGIGHAADQTIAQKMASIAAETPTASAFIILKKWDAIFEAVERCKVQFNHVFKVKIQEEKQLLQHYKQRFNQQQQLFFQKQHTILSHLNQKLQQTYLKQLNGKQQAINHMKQQFFSLKNQQLLRKKQELILLEQQLNQSKLTINKQLGFYLIELGHLKNRLNNVNPRTLLNRGFAVILPPKNQGKKIKSSINDFTEHQSFRILLKDGTITGETLSIEKNRLVAMKES